MHFVVAFSRIADNCRCACMCAMSLYLDIYYPVEPQHTPRRTFFGGVLHSPPLLSQPRASSDAPACILFMLPQALARAACTWSVKACSVDSPDFQGKIGALDTQFYYFYYSPLITGYPLPLQTRNRPVTLTALPLEAAVTVTAVTAPVLVGWPPPQASAVVPAGWRTRGDAAERSQYNI